MISSVCSLLFSGHPAQQLHGVKHLHYFVASLFLFIPEFWQRTSEGFVLGPSPFLLSCGAEARVKSETQSDNKSSSPACMGVTQDGQLHSLHPGWAGACAEPQGVQAPAGISAAAWQRLQEHTGLHPWAPLLYGPDRSLCHSLCRFLAVHQEDEGAEQHWLHMHEANSGEMS